jgi:hypothetical protein
VKLIPLTRGRFVKVDDADFDWLNQWRWYAHYMHGSWYAARASQSDEKGKQRYISMHRLILGTPKGMETDHIDHDGLNNQRSNIRVCTVAENARNRKLQTREGKSCSKYKGVSKRMGGSKWEACIKVGGKSTFIGHFDSDIDAAKAYDEFAIKQHGDYAKLNFPIETNRGDIPWNKVIKTSRFLGVGWHRAAAKWQSRIRINYEEIWLGLFVSDPKADAAIPYDAGEIEAALVRDAAAIGYHGESTKLNFISV